MSLKLQPNRRLWFCSLAHFVCHGHPFPPGQLKLTAIPKAWFKSQTRSFHATLYSVQVFVLSGMRSELED